MIRNKLLILPLIVITAVSVLIAGCDDGTGSSGSGTLTVEMTDAPIDSADAVNVFIERVEVKREEDTTWTVINELQREFDLLELTNGATEVIGTTQLEPGLYPQIRLILSSDGHSVVVDGTVHDMFVPSGAQTGIKLNVNAEIEEDIEFIILLDFDASRSVVEAGQSGMFILKPVVKATEKAITGIIDGVANPADARPVVYAIANSDTLASTIADTTTGEFRLIGLEAGTFDVSVNPRNDNFAEETVTGVEVTAGETTDVGTVDLSNTQ